ncbi:MAG: glutamine-hydrolyzing GMP synthase [Candidatus Aminicenantes bacterium]|nr:glutamine-hydrolyzing GMP synthase [Candidatus Aminicenantes bacterium]
MDKVYVLDFGSQYTQLIARKIRELGVYSEIFPYDLSPAKIRREKPGGIILSGGPMSVYERNAPQPFPELFELGIPILGICYGLQILALFLGGEVSPSQKREYGFASLEVLDRKGLLAGIKNGSQIWMSHGDKVCSIPPDFRITAKTRNSHAAVIESPQEKIFGVQFHPEVAHTRQGKKVLSNFLFSICKLKKEWNMDSFVESKAAEIRKRVRGGKVISGLSGGVDSLVASLIVQKAVEKKLTCIFVDNGLLRSGQFAGLLNKFRDRLHLNVVAVDAADRFLAGLRRVASPERKRKIIGEMFIRIFEEEAKKLGKVDFLTQGTIYPDVIESNPVKGPSSKIKSHHNVGGLPDRLKFKLIEPLKELFKDEVRILGKELGADSQFIHQHPFPGPGLAVRIVGEVTPERINILRKADTILLDEIRKARLYRKLWQAFAVLLPVKSVGVMGDKRTYQRVVVLRMVQSMDGMTADWYPAEPELLSLISNRIVNEVDGINRVVYDVTSKPPGTIEWE